MRFRPVRPAAFGSRIFGHFGAVEAADKATALATVKNKRGRPRGRNWDSWFKSMTNCAAFRLQHMVAEYLVLKNDAASARHRYIKRQELRRLAQRAIDLEMECDTPAEKSNARTTVDQVRQQARNYAR
jgi:hypothetical protein